MTTKYRVSDLAKDFGILTFADLLVMQREDLELTQVDMAEKDIMS